MELNQARTERLSEQCCGRTRAHLQALLSVSLGILLSLQSVAPAMAQERAAPSTVQQQSSTAGKSAASEPPGKTDMASATDPGNLPSAPEPQAAEPPAPAQAQSSSSQQQSTPQQPVGTAAAPYEKPTGVPGSRPAGAVIAPAKQRRVRAIVIKVGLLLAGGAAIGTVVGLSKASHSQP